LVIPPPAAISERVDEMWLVVRTRVHARVHHQLSKLIGSYSRVSPSRYCISR
jgi:hypothetical protein